MLPKALYEETLSFVVVLCVCSGLIHALIKLPSSQIFTAEVMLTVPVAPFHTSTVTYTGTITITYINISTHVPHMINKRHKHPK